MTDEDREFYGEFSPVIEQTMDLMVDRISAFLDELKKNNKHSTVEHFNYRTKRAVSMKGKLVRRGLEIDPYIALTELCDTVGLRIVTHFIGDVYQILDYLKASDEWDIVTIKDYIAQPKDNGYRSLHVILKVPVEDSKLPWMFVEIQMRTIAMDCWASLEHRMKYKKDVPNEKLMEAELKRCADEMASTDLTMQTIRDMMDRGGI